MAEFDNLIADVQAFLTTLNAQNNKTFWEAQKSAYEETLKKPALSLIDTLTPRIAALADCPVTGKLFRPHRDVRFSKDKTPYHTHLHMMWTLDAGARADPVFYFGVGLDYVTAGAGLMVLDKQVLADWRKMLDLDTDRMLGVLDRLSGAGYRFREPALKRVPAPYPSDHPAANYLRMKGVAASRELDAKGDLPDEIMAAFKDLKPLNDLLISVASD